MTVDGGAAAAAEKQAKKMSADEKEELKRRKQEKKQKQKRKEGAMDVLALMIIEAEARATEADAAARRERDKAQVRAARQSIVLWRGACARRATSVLEWACVYHDQATLANGHISAPAPRVRDSPTTAHSTSGGFSARSTQPLRPMR